MKQLALSDIHLAKPFIKWVGGKRQLIDSIDKRLFPIFSTTKGIKYVEPFVGGGAVFFHIMQKYRDVVKGAVICDVNTDLINAYKVIKEQPSDLVKSLREMENKYYSLSSDEQKQELFYEIREKYNHCDNDSITNTMYLIFLNRTCFNGLYRVNAKGEFNVPAGRYKHPLICDEETIIADSKCLKDVTILNGDFEITEEYANENTFFYLDPPYRPLDATSSFTSYSKDKFDDNDQKRLKLFIDRITEKKSDIMLSNSDGMGKNPDDNFFDVMYENYNINRVVAKRSINANPNKRGKLTELLITNF